ncbi:MAG: GspH/FimT family pseudopilin, partial [Candidatus Competibacteraceae bacterium]|nr:GspH/FimT family pseudopilin [Candidatus Competibacteraceae bacterium]
MKVSNTLLDKLDLHKSFGLSKDILMKQNGFTLLELMVTMAIAAIVLTVAVPSFQGIILNNRIASHTNDFASSLNLARSEAVKRARRTVLCKSSDGATCDTSSAGWEQGW